MIGGNVASTLYELRAQAESMMVDACLITRGGEPTWDDVNGVWDTGDATTVYDGPCKVQTRDVQVLNADIAGREGAVVSWQIHLPVDGSEGVRVGDTVTITDAANDAELAGKTFTVQGPHVGSLKTARRLPVRAEVSSWT